jgi:hypothetical protein
MKKMKKILALIGIPLLLFGCSEKGLQNLNDVLSTTKDVLAEYEPIKLTNTEVISGLKEALKVGTDSAVGLVSKMNGFYKNPSIFIEFPPEAIKVKNTLNDAGFGSLMDDFEMTLNRSAEEAAKLATPIFKDAITSMSISDGFTLLNGSNNAATNCLQEKTSSQLKEKFSPVVNNAINKVQLTKHWEPILKKYNLLTLLTGADAINPDLEAYVTQKTLDGLFLQIAKEEKQIRENPSARVSDILQRVFGS